MKHNTLSWSLTNIFTLILHSYTITFCRFKLVCVIPCDYAMKFTVIPSCTLHSNLQAQENAVDVFGVLQFKMFTVLETSLETDKQI